jgi:hypothetical protein
MPQEGKVDKMNIYTGLFIQFLAAFDSQINFRSKASINLNLHGDKQGFLYTYIKLLWDGVLEPGTLYYPLTEPTNNPLVK